MTHAPASLDAFEHLPAVAPGEVLTHAAVTDHALPHDAGTLALITLDNGQGPRRPATLGPASLLELARVVDEQAARAEAGQIQALAITGVEGTFAAGADLSLIAGIEDATVGRSLALLGHAAYDRIDAFPVLGERFDPADARWHVQLDHRGSGVEVLLRETLSEPLLSTCAALEPQPVRQFETVDIRVTPS